MQPLSPDQRLMKFIACLSLLPKVGTLYGQKHTVSELRLVWAMVGFIPDAVDHHVALSLYDDVASEDTLTGPQRRQVMNWLRASMAYDPQYLPSATGN